MRVNKLILVTIIGLTLTACSSQMQIEPAAGTAALGIKHSHTIPGRANPLVHQHGGDSSPSHSHTMSQIRNQL